MVEAERLGTGRWCIVGGMAWLGKLDEILFSPHGMGLRGRVFVSPAVFQAVMKLRVERLEPITVAALLKLGWMGVLYHPMFDLRGAQKAGMVLEAGRQIWVCRHVPDGFVYIDRSEEPYPMHGPVGEDQLISLETP